MEKIVTLSDGTEVKCFVVPVWMVVDVERTLEIVRPEEPKKKVKSIVAGHTEEIPYTEDDTDPEWLEYKNALAEYQKEDERFTTGFVWDAGVVGWKLPGKKKFTSDPPSDWVTPPVLERMKIFSSHVDARRVSYIKYGLLTEVKDTNTVAQVIYGGALLSSEEVDGAVNSFPS